MCAIPAVDVSTLTRTTPRGLHGLRTAQETIGDVGSCDGQPAGRAHAGSRHDRGIPRGLAESPVAPVASRASVREDAQGDLPTVRPRLDQVIDEAHQCRVSGTDGVGGSALLRVRHRLQPRRRAGGRCDHFRLGPMRIQRRAIAVRDRLRGRRRRLDQGAPGAPELCVGGICNRGQSANTVGLAAGRWQVLHQRLGCRSRRAARRTANPGRRVRRAPRDDRPICSSPRSGGKRDRRGTALPNGAMDTGALRAVLGDDPSVPTIVCAAAGNVNTGACDDMTTVVDAAHAVGAWVHVDGAFGLGRPRARALHISSEESSARIRGHATGTSGSTSPTTRATRSVRTRGCTRRHWRIRRRI